MAKIVSLTEENLIELLKGEVIEIDEVEIALQDIGFDKIINALIDHLQ